MSARKSEAEQAGILVLGQIAANVADVLVPLFIVRLLDRDQVGIWAGVLVAYHTIAIILSGGFPSATLYSMAGKSPGERRSLVFRLIRIMFVLGALAMLVMLSLGYLSELWSAHFSDATAPGTRSTAGGSALPFELLSLLALYPLFDLPVRLMPSVLLSEGKARLSAGVGVLRSLINTAAVLIPAALGYGVKGIIVGTVLLGASQCGVFLGLMLRHYREAPRGVPAAPARELLRVALPLGATDIINTLNARLDLWLIILVFSAEAVADYRIGAWQIPAITTLAYSTGSAYLPKLADLFQAGKPREAIALWQRAAEKVALISVPVAFVFVVGAEPFIQVAFGESYDRAVGVFRCYSLLTAGRIAAFGSVMVAAGKPGYVMRSALLTLLSNAVISVPLLLTLGFIGPALGTLIAFAPTLFFYCFFIGSAAGMSVREVFPFKAYARPLGAVSLPALLALLMITAVNLPAWLEFALAALIVLGGFSLVGTLARLITPQDWRFASDWLRLRVLR